MELTELKPLNLYLIGDNTFINFNVEVFIQKWSLKG